MQRAAVRLVGVSVAIALAAGSAVAARPGERTGSTRRMAVRRQGVRRVRSLRASAGRVLRRAMFWRNPVRANRTELAAVDRLIAGLHAKGDHVEISLKGSTLYRTLAAIDRGKRPRYTDVDLAIHGVRESDALHAVKRAFPEVDLARDVVRKPAFLHGVTHVQVEVPATATRRALQLDLSLFEPGQSDASARRSFPGVSFTKMRLAIPAGTRLSDLLRRTWIRGGRGVPELRDPDRTGTSDIRRGLLRVNPISTARARLPEGLFHGMYLIGKRAGFRFHRGTAKVYREMPAEELVRFLAGDGPGSDLARVRTGYLLSAFRTDAGRDPRSTLEVGREVELWGKVLPGMDAVTSNAARWHRTVARVDAAYRSARQPGAAPERTTREWVFGALLSELATPAAAGRAITHLSLEPEQRARILRSYDHHHR